MLKDLRTALALVCMTEIGICRPILVTQPFSPDSNNLLIDTYDDVYA